MVGKFTFFFLFRTSTFYISVRKAKSNTNVAVLLLYNMDIMEK